MSARPSSPQANSATAEVAVLSGPLEAAVVIGAKDLPREDSIDRQVWRLALPSIGENLLQTLTLFVDTWMVASYGSIPIAASSVAGTLLWRTHMTLGCIEKGTTAMVARYIGERDAERAGQTVAQSILLATIIGSFVSIVGIVFCPTFLSWMRTPAELMPVAVPFLRVIFLVSAARMFFFVASASLRGSGDTRSPMRISFWMNIVNFAFNYVLIFGHFGFPELKLLGSGISTALSITFSAGAIAFILTRGRTAFRVRARYFRPDWKIIKTLLWIAGPAFLEEIIISVGYLIFFSYINVLGADLVAANAISTRVESLSFMAGFGFAVAAATLVGQSLGRRSIELARKSFHKTTMYCVFVMSGIAVVLICGGQNIIALFARDPVVAGYARILLIIAAVEQPLLGIFMTLSGGIRGAGDTVSPMICSFVGNVLVRVFIVYWLTFTLKLGIYGIYLGTVIDWTVRTSLLFLLYRRGRWMRIAI